MNEQANMAARYEHEIPEGYEARIEGNKVILEQKESEDEKIRKCIGMALTDVEEQRFMDYSTSLKDCLSWLDKQKAQKPAEIRDSRQIALMIENGRRCGVIEGRKQVVGNPEEYGLCKPAEWSRQSIIDALTKWLTEKIAPLHKKSLDGIITEKEEMFRAALLEMRSLVNSPDFQIGEDTSAEWSEEDEKMRASIIMTLAGFMGNEDKISWLNSLRNKPCAEHCQPTVSDLAIKFINYLDRNRPEGKMCLSNGECEDINEAFKKNDLDRIMRYVRKYSWQPTEEQICALQAFVGMINPDARYNAVLSLLNDLKNHFSHEIH